MNEDQYLFYFNFNARQVEVSKVNIYAILLVQITRYFCLTEFSFLQYISLGHKH